jgi:purine-binding chemotaxis protein CheW
MMTDELYMEEVAADDELMLSQDGEQYLFFMVGEDMYGINSTTVLEMVEYQGLTKVPMMQSYVKGVTNVRGNIIPVIDLQGRFGMGESEISERTSLVIVKKKLMRMEDESEEMSESEEMMAIVVDRVHEVGYISEKDIKQVPAFGTKIATKYIKDMAMYKNEYVALLNIDTILDYREISQLGGHHGS